MIVRSIRHWLYQLARELGGSPLAQLTFFLTVLAAIVAVLTAWDFIRNWLINYFQTLVISVVLASGISWSGVLFVRRIRRVKRSSEILVGEAAEYIEGLLNNGVVLTRIQATKLLSDRFGVAGGPLLQSLLDDGYIRIDFSDKLLLTNNPKRV